MSNELFFQAKELYDQERWSDFNQFFGKNVEYNLDAYQQHQAEDLCFWQGMAYLKQNLLNKAKQSFDGLAQKYPHSHLADEGKVSLLFLEKNYQEVIKVSFSFQEKHPAWWQPHHWRGNAYLALHRYDDAIREFEIIKLIYPDIMQGYEGVYNAKRKKFRSLGYHSNNKELLEDLKELILHKDSNRYQKFDYVKTLISTSRIEQAKEWLYILDGYPEELFLAKALIAKWHNEHTLAFDYFNRALEVSDDKTRVLGIAYNTFKKLKKHDEYVSILEQLRNTNPNNVNLMLSWTDAYTIGHSWRYGWTIASKRLERIICQNGVNELPIVERYIRYLIGLNKFNEAELIISLARKIYTKEKVIYKLYCVISHHKKEWKIAKERIEEFIKEYPKDYSLFYYYIHCLYHLKEFKNMEMLYHSYISNKFRNIYENEQLNNFQINLLLGGGGGEINHKTIYCNSYPELDKMSDALMVINEVIHSLDNQVLVLCFDGLRAEYVTQDNFDNMSSVHLAEYAIKINSPFNDFSGFAKYGTQFNYLLIRDFSSSYGLLNFEKNLENIKNKINAIKPKYLVCMGLSAGGFSSILYGEYLKANVVFAMMPALQAFFGSILKATRRKIQEHFRLINPEMIDIASLQRKQKSFKAKVYMTFCDNEPVDILRTYPLNKNDKNLHISYFEGDVHPVLEYVGAKNIYSEITRVIEKELANNFELPMQRDIFSQIDGYQDSSFDRLKNE